VDSTGEEESRGGAVALRWSLVEAESGSRPAVPGDRVWENYESSGRSRLACSSYTGPRPRYRSTQTSGGKEYAPAHVVVGPLRRNPESSSQIKSKRCSTLPSKNLKSNERQGLHTQIIGMSKQFLWNADAWKNQRG
jgi:hypothetical protein